MNKVIIYIIIFIVTFWWRLFTVKKGKIGRIKILTTRINLLKSYRIYFPLAVFMSQVNHKQGVDFSFLPRCRAIC